MNPQRVAAAAAVLSVCGLLAGVALPALQSPQPVDRIEITTTSPEPDRQLHHQAVNNPTTSMVPNVANHQSGPGAQPVRPPAENRPPAQAPPKPPRPPADDDSADDSDG